MNVDEAKVRALLKGRIKKNEGIAKAAERKKLAIWQSQLALLRAIRTNPERLGTTDDACTDLETKWPDGGKWRGQVTRELARLGLIEKHGFAESSRTARKGGILSQWHGLGDAGIDYFASHLETIIGTAEAGLQRQGELFPEGGQ